MTEVQESDQERLSELFGHLTERRLAIFLAADGKTPVTGIAERTGLSMSAVSQQIARLSAAKLLVKRREAQTIYYARNPAIASEIQDLCARLLPVVIHGALGGA